MNTLNNYISEKLFDNTPIENQINYEIINKFLNNKEVIDVEKSYSGLLPKKATGKVEIENIEYKNNIYNIFLKNKFNIMAISEQDILNLKMNMNLNATNDSVNYIYIKSIKSTSLNKKSIIWLNNFLKNIHIQYLTILIENNIDYFNIENLNLKLYNDYCGLSVYKFINGSEFQSFYRIKAKNINIDPSNSKGFTIDLFDLESINELNFTKKLPKDYTLSFSIIDDYLFSQISYDFLHIKKRNRYKSEDYININKIDAINKIYNKFNNIDIFSIDILSSIGEGNYISINTTYEKNIIKITRIV